MNFKYEKTKLAEGFNYIIGCDEVGRGCLAGPVVAAAVILDIESNLKDLAEVRDSKLLKPKSREELDGIIKKNCVAWSIAEVSSEEVDRINIHNASLLAMKKAVDGLVCHCEGVHLTEAILNKSLEKDCFVGQSMPWPPRNDKFFLFVDGKFKVPDLEYSQEAVVSGDNKVLSIAAASIIAKVYRDNLMQEFDKQYQGYELARHKGYATLQHRKMIIKNGLSPIHRLSFCGNYL